MRKPYWGCTIKFYFGSASIEFDRALRVLGGFGIRTNFRIYGKRYWAWKKKMKLLKERMNLPLPGYKKKGIFMDPRTGEIHYFGNEEERRGFEKGIGRMLVPLTEKKARELKPLSNRRRKALLAGMSCPCGSGKSFKKCCWKKYK